MPLFEVAITENPTKKEAEDGATEKLIMAPKAVIARDQQSAAVAAALEAGVSFDPNKSLIHVRPFA
jgi:hypothetical protein